MGAIYKKEMRTFFVTPIGYIFLASAFLISSAAFCFTTLKMASWNTKYYFTIMIFVFIILSPMLTMKLFSEERRTRTEQMLLTSPVSLTGMVLAKYLSAMTMMGGILALTSVYFIPLYSYAEPTTAILIGNLIALIMVGSATVSIGIFISSLTENQMVAAVVTMVTLFLLMGAGFVNQYIDSYFIRSIFSWISIFNRFGNFMHGIFDFS
ncbi:MAG TPA: ABC transporter permease, partial [Bacillota bacterium]|nr:ABC transporter permease [Bacillota bacterium]